MSRARRPKMQQAARAGDLIDKLFKGLGLADRMQQYRALIIWEQVVGQQIAARTRPVKVRENILEVNVDQTAWMQQLQLMKPKILASLNNQLGKGTIKDLYLKLGKVKGATKPMAQPPAWRMVHLDDSEKLQVQGLLTRIDDPELREEMEKFLQKQLRLLKAEAGNSS
ncbi:MAG: DciA family protein [Desulfuromonadales bacterium]